MANDAVPLPRPDSIADDEVEDARYLADLLSTLQAHAEAVGLPKIANIVDEARVVAQALADEKTKGKPH